MEFIRKLDIFKILHILIPLYRTLGFSSIMQMSGTNNIYVYMLLLFREKVQKKGLYGTG